MRPPFTLVLEKESALPLYRQLFERLRTTMLSGHLRPGDSLPTTRQLSAQCRISRNTVVTAYEMLKAEGYINARTGSGYYVADAFPDHALPPTAIPASPATSHAPVALPGDLFSERGRLLAQPSRPVPATLATAFMVGLPDLKAFPHAQWARCLQKQSRQPDTNWLRYQDQGGLPELKNALHQYLTLSRGVRCTPAQIIIVNGSQAGLDLIARLLLDEGDVVAIEEPGYPGARDAFLAAGATLQPIAVDEHGIQVDALAGLFNTPDKAPTLIYTTPSDQFPLGTTLSLSRRLTMLEQVANRHCWIIEDDYDSEYRFHQRPLSSLQGLDNHQRVIYLGTFSKVMFPGLRLGYLVVPAAMVAACRQALRKTGQDAPLIWQAAMADFIQGGHFASHIRRMRRLYGDKQRQFIHLLDQQLHHWLEPVPTGAGMQLACWFKHPVDTRRLLATAQAQDLIVPLLSRCYLAPPERDGVQLGYAGVPPQEMARQVVKLRSVFENS